MKCGKVPRRKKNPTHMKRVPENFPRGAEEGKLDRPVRNAALRSKRVVGCQVRKQVRRASELSKIQKGTDWY